VTLWILADLNFSKWSKENGLDHKDLIKVADEIEKGLLDAHLGGFLVKKRIASATKGKRSGFRTIIAFRRNDRLVFLHGFAKSETENISLKERSALSKLADIYIRMERVNLKQMIEKKLILEIRDDEPHS
jgi:hypothetical protein